MSEKKNIDRLFQEKFKDYEVIPDPKIWKNLEQRLQKKEKRRIVPLWLRFGGAAAILLLLISSGFWYFGQNDTVNTNSDEIIITDTDNNLDDEVKNNEENIITNTDQTKNIKEQNLISTSEVENKTKTAVKKKSSPSEKKIINMISKDDVRIADNKTDEVESLNDKQNHVKLEKIAVDIQKELDNSEQLNIAKENIVEDQENEKKDILKEIEKNKIDEKTYIADENDKWSVGSIISPIYYGSLSKGSPIDPSLANNNKNNDASASYGLKVNYKLSDKFSLQSGINRVELGYSTDNVTTLLSSSLLDGSSSNINTNVDGTSVEVLSTNTQSPETPTNQRASFDLSGNLDQSMSYVEIPLEAKYNLFQRKLGVNLIGGFSTYYLYHNEVSITSFGKSTTLGEASNLNTLNFSGNLGLDFDYNISKKLFINISPMFKYQFNTFSKNSGGFQPYYLGVYTGLNFRF